MQTVSSELIKNGAGAPLEALAIAKQFAPVGRPNFGLILKEGTQLSVWNKVHGQASTAKFIFLFLVSLNKYFNVVRPMSTDQMQELAMEFSEYTVFKFEDFIAFFECVKKQRYGVIRDRIDPATIWEMFREYDRERDAECERMAREKIGHVQPSRQRTPDELKTNKFLSVGGAMGDISKQLKRKSDG